MITCETCKEEIVKENFWEHKHNIYIQEEIQNNINIYK